MSFEHFAEVLTSDREMITIVPTWSDEALRANTSCGKTKAEKLAGGAWQCQAMLGMNTAGIEINQERVFVFWSAAS